MWEYDAYVTVQKKQEEKSGTEIGKNVNSLSCYTYVMYILDFKIYRFHNAHENFMLLTDDDSI